MPDDWTETTLGDVATWYSGATPKAGNPEYYEGGTIEWATIGDIQDRAISMTATKITEAGAAVVGRIAPPGAVLVSMYGTIGRTGLTLVPMATNQAIAWGVTNPAECSGEFLFLVMQSLRPRLDSLGRGATQRNINREILRDQSFLLPPLQVQRRIVDLISAIEAQVQAVRAECLALNNVKALGLNALFGGGASDCTLGELIRLDYGDALPARDREAGDVKVFGSAGMTGLHSRANVGSERPIVVGRKGVDARASLSLPIREDSSLPMESYRGWGGAGSVRWCDGPHWVIDTAYAVTPMIELDARLLYWLLVSIDLTRATTKTTLPGLSRESAYRLAVRLPSDPGRCLDLLDVADATQTSLLHEEIALRRLRTTLTTSCLSGATKLPAFYDDLLEAL